MDSYVPFRTKWFTDPFFGILSCCIKVYDRTSIAMGSLLISLYRVLLLCISISPESFASFGWCLGIHLMQFRRMGYLWIINYQPISVLQVGSAEAEGVLVVKVTADLPNPLNVWCAHGFLAVFLGFSRRVPHPPYLSHHPMGGWCLNYFSQGQRQCSNSIAMFTAFWIVVLRGKQ